MPETHACPGGCDWHAGYDAAVEELRGVVRRSGSPSAEWAAGYLAVQRKYVEQRVLEGASVGAPRLVEGGHVWSPPGDIQQCVNCRLTRAAYFATSARRPCPRPPSAQLLERRDERYYLMHDHGPNSVRHAHSVEQGHFGDVNNPKANDHTGVPTGTWDEMRAQVAPERSDEEPKKHASPNTVHGGSGYAPQRGDENEQVDLGHFGCDIPDLNHEGPCVPGRSDEPTGRYWDATARGHLADYLETVGPTPALNADRSAEEQP